MNNRYQSLASFRLPPGTRGRHGLIVLLWQLVQATVFAWSPQPAYVWRRSLLVLFGAKLGSGVRIRQTVRVTYPWFLTIGRDSWIGDHVELYSVSPITIGSDTCISQKTYVCAGTHDAGQLDFPVISMPVVIGNEVWVAADCFIGPGVQIGDGAVIAMRSTVATDIDPGTIYSGGPATARGRRLPSKTANR